jgi:hypothetical protein
MLNDHAANQRDEFYEEHGHFVTTPEGVAIFHDGSTDEASMTGLGVLSPPSSDKFERAKMVAHYWKLVAEITEEQFLNFKNYLNGTGRREPAWATLYTEEERLAHLKSLQQQAKRTRAKYLKAKREVKEQIPFWIEEREQLEIEEEQRKQQFLSEVDQINI